MGRLIRKPGGWQSLNRVHSAFLRPAIDIGNGSSLKLGPAPRLAEAGENPARSRHCIRFERSVCPHREPDPSRGSECVRRGTRYPEEMQRCPVNP